MFWIDFILVLFLALAFSVLLSWALGWRHPARRDGFAISFIFLFMILLLAMWAAGAWFRPWGPVVLGAPWLLILLIGIFISLLILALTLPVKRPRTPLEAKVEAHREAEVERVFGLFFWILIFGLLIAVVLSYFF